MSDTFEPDLWLEKYGDALFRYALFRVGDESAAEDLVQETLLAGINSRDSFSHQSTEQTWLTGILKHKIIDHLRKRAREQTASFDYDPDREADGHSFDGSGRWNNPPSEWKSPQQDLQNEQFWRIFRDCLSRLPEQTANLFILREMEGVAGEDLCKLFGIGTTNNLWVMLSRTRMKLRLCLETHWFDKGK
ncbi:MAG: sigma-70 family RNA polymerase sigma factor [Gammaproteobacteria bacterium]